jgi:hypothetical protein
MANPENAAALRALIEEFNRQYQAHDPTPGELAAWLTAQGVLVPSSVTEQQFRRMVRDQSVGIAVLERIAKGE